MNLQTPAYGCPGHGLSCTAYGQHTKALLSREQGARVHNFVIDHLRHNLFSG